MWFLRAVARIIYYMTKHGEDVLRSLDLRRGPTGMSPGGKLTQGSRIEGVLRDTIRRCEHIPQRS
jgi:hypothetical protein